MASTSGPFIAPALTNTKLEDYVERGQINSELLRATSEEIQDLDLQNLNLDPDIVDQINQLKDQVVKSDNVYVGFPWNDHNTSGSAGVPFSTFGRAIGSLRGPGHPQLNWPHVPDVDVEVYPFGHNIRIDCTRDNGAAPTAEYDERLGRCEGFYNVRDGLIVLTRLRVPDNNPDGSVPDWSSLADVVWVIWNRLHSRRGENTMSQALYDAQSAGEASVRQSIKSDKSLPDLPPGILGTWMTVVSTGRYRLPARSLARMKNYLNYIVTQDHSAETKSVIERCAKSRQTISMPVVAWGHHETFRGILALLGTEIGGVVTQLLARRKAASVLGIKVIKSITIFQTDHVEGLTDGEHKQYVEQLALLFEVVDKTEEVLNEESTTVWTYRPRDANTFTDIPQPRIATDGHNQYQATGAD